MNPRVGKEKGGGGGGRTSDFLIYKESKHIKFLLRIQIKNKKKIGWGSGGGGEQEYMTFF